MKKTTMFVFMIVFCGASLRAEEPRINRWRGTSSPAAVPAQEAPAALQKIFSNLGTSTDAYNDTIGWPANGPLSGFGQDFVGLPFTPTANAHVYVVRAAIQYQSSGANQVNLNLYSDVNGAPGTVLAGPVTVKNLPTFGTCCTLAEATFTAGAAVTAGTQYWVVANTPTTGTGSDFEGVWDFIATTYLNSFDTGSGWNSFKEDAYEPAGAVYGTIP